MIINNKMKICLMHDEIYIYLHVSLLFLLFLYEGKRRQEGMTKNKSN